MGKGEKKKKIQFKISYEFQQFNPVSFIINNKVSVLLDWTSEDGGAVAMVI